MRSEMASAAGSLPLDGALGKLSTAGRSDWLETGPTLADLEARKASAASRGKGLHQRPPAWKRGLAHQPLPRRSISISARSSGKAGWSPMAERDSRSLAGTCAGSELEGGGHLQRFWGLRGTRGSRRRTAV